MSLFPRQYGGDIKLDNFSMHWVVSMKNEVGDPFFLFHIFHFVFQLQAILGKSSGLLSFYAASNDKIIYSENSKRENSKPTNRQACSLSQKWNNKYDDLPRSTTV